MIRLSIAGSLRERPARARKTCPSFVPDFAAIGKALRGGQLVVDRVFDEVYPDKVREVSSVYWTPVEVAMRAARLLTVDENSRILDIGSGVGKFCIVASAVGARVHGIEHRAHFVEIAREAASKVGVQPEFHHGALETQDPTAFDGIYLFNPFAENVSPREDHLDETVELSDERFGRDIELAERFLEGARLGTRVVTYCGFGGTMPPAYRVIRSDFEPGRLELWVKTSEKRRDTLPVGPAADVVSLSAWRTRVAAAGAAGAWAGDEDREEDDRDPDRDPG